MAAKKGSLSISSENIFPIIKKWVYSDHDIFARELVSNGCDAITKLKKLDMMGEYTLPDDYKGKIQVIVNPEEKTLKFIDNGLGMTADEVEEYITQIAFSGATEFLNKYKDKTTEDDMIGHFGLGFYSAFMVADEVHIDTISYKEGAKPVHWVSEGGTEYEMEEGDKEEVGSEITLFLNEDCVEFSNEYRIREVLEKYCSFMPVEIFVSKANAEPEYETIPEDEVLDTDTVVEHIHEDAKMEEKENENGEKEMVEVSPASDKAKIVKRPVSISDPAPLWTKHPNECSKEDYIDFYRKVFMDYKEPLFWIHLNMDYPFNLKGILYFPKINTEYDSIEGTIKLYPLSKKRLFAHHYYACLCKKSLSHLVHMKNFGKSHRPGSRSDMACHTQRQWIHPDFKLRKCFMKLIQPFLCLLAVSCVSCIQIQIFFPITISEF